ncbi:hypothetical protein [uncultured Microbulbifer sp.]|uniref:hypothetical protein n=1 Tax=uncultured Microbulbifer sp. TaxID=348147 RepID=UPI002630D9B6|nr:hypothetical protein [uncultured Microbulbifer sp.]
MKNIPLLSLMFISSTVFAEDVTSVDPITKTKKSPSEYGTHIAYLENPKNRARYEEYLAAGTIENLRNSKIKACSDEKKGIAGFCECFTVEIRGLSNEEMFYDHALLMEVTLNSLTAMGNNDSSERDKIIENIQTVTSLGKIESKCRASLSES